MIELRQVSKSFAARTVVNHLTLKIDEGEIIGFLGPNGAGKTTTIRMIAGILPPTSGEILVNGKNLFGPDEIEKKNVGYLPEGNPLYEDLTAEEFLIFWSKVKGLADPERSTAINQIVITLGLREVYYRPIRELSKGFRQRLGLAQALLSQPPILLLDEPTEGLDPNQRREIHHLVTHLGKQRTVVICSHVLAEVAKMCQRVIIIHQGKIVADDELKNLTQRISQRPVLNLIAQGNRVSESLRHLSSVRLSHQSLDETGTISLTIESLAGQDLRPQIFERSRLDGWQILELSTQKQSLEDVFAQLTEKNEDSPQPN